MRRYERSWWWYKEKKDMALVLIAITMILQLQMKGCVGCLETERIGLLELKSYLNSLLPPSPQDESILMSWSDDGSERECCLWEKVNCSDAIGGHIVHLSLNGILGWDASGSLNLSLLHNFPQLKTFDFSHNWISHLFDPIHGYKSFQRLEKLRTLDLSINYLNNSVLPFLSAAGSLKTLNLERNRMKGVFPPNGLINLRKLEVLDLSVNLMTEFEAFDGVVFPSSLQVLKLGNNQLTSTLKGFSKICAFKNLRELDLGYNALTNLPYCLGNLSHLRTLDLTYNQLNGNLSSFVSGLPSTLEYLSLLDNNFTGSFLFKSLVNHTGLKAFKLSSSVGMIQAEAESSWVPLFQLKRLELQNFIFGSIIPRFLLHQHDLCYVDLSYNELTGAFPTWLVQNNTKLHAIFLNSNSLTKLQLPSLVHGLQALDISSNMIHDSIQEDIGIVFPVLSHMNFSSNHFYGNIPPSIGQMKSVESSDFLTKNRDEAYQCDILRDMYGLDLSSNDLSGEIPIEIGKLESIRSLNLSNNHLTGSIPNNISKMKDLEILDLSNNKLDGNIPSQLADLSLVYFNVSFNNLSGEIPLNANLFTFGETSYIGNAHLCGLPTNEICNSERVQEQSEEDEEGFMVWFFWTCGAVYISTLLALSAFLCIDTQWSREWFYRVDLSVHHLHQCFKRRFVCN